ncbi:MAG: peptidylprolyl isomerase [Candidatus Hydrothermae bacterium]|nr:peptidylprolyl isomerase [Candidatus Hydrothermae bacterium]
MMRSLLPLLLPVLLLAQNAAPTFRDRVAAVVDGETILLSEVDEALALMVPPQAIQSKEMLDSLRRQVLDELIKRKILYLEAQKDTTLQVTDAEVEDALDQQLKAFENQMGKENFEKALKEQGETRESLKRQYREKVREDLYVQKFVQKKFGAQFVVTPDELKAFYEQVKDSLRKPVEVRLSQIVVLIKPTDKALNQAKKKAATIAAQIKAGRLSFDQAVQQYSDDRPTARQGGFLGWVSKQELPTLIPDSLASILLNLKVGELSDPLPLPLGYGIFQVADRKDDRIALRYLLVRASQTVQDTLRARKRAQRIYARSKKGEDFATLASQLSDDRATRDLGGDAGWKVLEALPEPIRKVVEDLKPGDVTEPIFYQGAFWIFRLTDRRGGEMASFEEVQPQLQQLLIQRKLQAAVDRFVEKARKRIYVDVKL